MLQKVKLFIIHLSIIGIIFLLLVMLLDNKNTMIVTMESTSAVPLEAELYYTTEGQAFSDTKMSRRYKIKHNKYYFKLPSFDKIQYARFDPSKRNDNIIIKQINIIISHWFTTSIYSIDITKSQIVQQISNYKIDKNLISFTTTNRDAQLNLNFSRNFIQAFRNLHIDTFLIALLVYGLFLFLFQLSKEKEFTPLLSSKLILYSLFLALALFKVDYYKEHVHYNYTPDNIAHLSYIEYLHNHSEILPKFENMFMITNKNAGNYLGHSPLYYHFMNIVYNENYSVVGNVDNFRTLNTILFATTILLLLYLGFASSLSLLGHFVYLSIISSLPMHAYLGSNVSNDNLAVFGGVLFLIALLKLLRGEYNNHSYLLLSAGIFIAYFAKLTAGILVFFASVYFFFYIFKNKIPFSITKKQALILSLSVIPILSYQLYIALNYHTLIPTLNATHPAEYLTSGFYIPEASRHYLTALEWLQNYWGNVHAGWFGILSHHSLVKPSIFQYIGLLLLHIFALIALFIPCEEKQKTFCVLGRISLFSFISIAIVQYTFSYLGHLNSGYMGGLQTRYLLPFMVAFAIMASIFVNRFKESFFMNIVVIILCIHAIYSDFFYFLKYYI